ncbi:MAG: 3-phosphoshikimate 1-carboxyvinyltransferase [Saprospiraceae bacterium]|nr:3-phosphoshikimate 1-carboxyvinyltransferase [Saprospiraceae bacterium]
MTITLTASTRHITGDIALAGSKSISNRALIIRALCDKPFPIHRLADARDTQLLDALLQSTGDIRDAGHAGTTFRFLTAYLAFQPGVQTLTGSERMQQRPIGLLVDALRQLGAQIDYLGKEGYPPLRIGEARYDDAPARLSIAADTSSQFISALLMIAPTLPQGLELTLEGNLVSRPYILMTLRLMEYFGVQHTWKDRVIRVAPQSYVPRPFTVEADWSAASYYYAIAALSDSCDLHLEGLFANSVQGDSVIKDIMLDLGVGTTFTETGIRLQKLEIPTIDVLDWDFLDCPDIAQTLAVVCGATDRPGYFTGLETLHIKETDRVAALQAELSRIGVIFTKLPPALAPNPNRDYYLVDGSLLDLSTTPLFHTYEDHRMAMAFAPLALLAPIRIADPGVVEKSYPGFWQDLERIGFETVRLSDL